MLNIEDFESIQKNKETNQEENYKEKYQLLLKKYEEEKNKIFEEGYKKGYEEAQKELTKKHEEEKNRLISKFEIEKQEILKENEIILQEELTKLYEEVKNQIKIFKEHFTNLLVDSLEEILEILFISQANAPVLKEKINKIINELEEEKFIKVIVNQELFELIKDANFKVEKGNIEKGTFIIKFDNFYIESKLKEKMETIKNEIKREIKENT
jgi:flagellar biosynthesis/type III secretory pathway protein FliH